MRCHDISHQLHTIDTHYVPLRRMVACVFIIRLSYCTMGLKRSQDTFTSHAWQQQIVAVTEKATQCGDKFLIVCMSFPVALSLISCLEAGQSSLFNLFLTAGCHTQTTQYLTFIVHLGNAFSESFHAGSSSVPFSLFILTLLTFTHLSCFCSADINECLSARACQLSERCVNTAGSYVCQRLITCSPGYQINNDVCEGTTLSAESRIKVFTSTHCEYVCEGAFPMAGHSQFKEGVLFRNNFF